MRELNIENICEQSIIVNEAFVDENGNLHCEFQIDVDFEGEKGFGWQDWIKVVLPPYEPPSQKP